MLKENKAQALRSLIRKTASGTDPDVELLKLFRRHCPADASPGDELREMAQWFVAIRELSRHGSLPAGFNVAGVARSFLKLARDRGLGAEEFYDEVLSAVLMDGQSGEPSPGVKLSTRARILEAALDVFYEKGFHLATVDEIAERAGVGKGTLYRYFTNKEKLFSDLVRVRLEELERSATEVLDGDDDVLTMITKYLRIYFEFFDHNNRLYRLISQEQMEVGRAVEDLYFKKVIRRIPVLKRKIYGASQQGLLKDIDFNTVFYGVMGFMHGVIQKWLARDCSYSLVDELPGVVEVLFYGFVNTAKTENVPKS